jgi:GTPase SAR1 family protein
MKSLAINKGSIYDLQYLNRYHQTEGFDERYIYSYLRYHNEENLLIVVNFNQTETYNFSVKIPYEALSLMDLENKEELSFVSVFDKKLKFKIASAKLNIVNDRFSGLPIVLEPKSGLILRIN